MENRQKKSVAIFVAGVVALLLLVVGIVTGLQPFGEKVELVESGESEQSQSEFFQVTHVFDGDTFSVDVESGSETVRVIGIDSPETGEKYTNKECFSKEASAKAVKLLQGEFVRLEADSTQANRDKYGRLLRYVFLEDGTFFNQVMIEEGFAEEYTYNDSKYKYQDDFLTAQQQAKENKVGMWARCKK